MRGNAHRCRTRPIVYDRKHWWLLTNYGIPIGVYPTQQDCVKKICDDHGVSHMLRVHEIAYEVRKVKVTAANRSVKP